MQTSSETNLPASDDRKLNEAIARSEGDVDGSKGAKTDVARDDGVETDLEEMDVDVEDGGVVVNAVGGEDDGNIGDV